MANSSDSKPSFSASRDVYFRLLGYVRPYWRAIALALLATAITAATEPLFPALLKPMLDQGFAAASKDKAEAFTNPLWIPAGIVGVFILRGIFNYLSSYGFAWVSQKVVTDIRQAMYAKLVRLPVGYFQQNSSSVPVLGTCQYSTPSPRAIFSCGPPFSAASSSSTVGSLTKVT